VSDDLGFTCSCCGQYHPGLAQGFSFEAPVYWSAELAADESSVLGPEQCVIKGEHYFIRGLIEIPVLDSGEVFSWDVWVSLSKDSFRQAVSLWESAGREAEPPYFGWLSSELGMYSPSTVNLKTNVHTRPIGVRPLVELEPTGHPLAVEQRTGITRERMRELVEAAMHPGR
jgi:hypothetical protein